MSLGRRPLSALALLALALAWGASACHAADDPARALLPKAMAGLALGMSEADFRKARPAAERFEIFGEPEVKGDDPNPWYTEPLKGDPLFELATYTFGGHRLCAVALSAVGQGEAIRQRQARVLQGGVRKWGSRYERLWQVSAGRGSNAKLVRRPALLWKLDSYRVLAKFSAGGAAPNGRGEINLAILDPRCLPANVRQDLFNTLVPANDPGADAAFKVLDAPVEPPLLE